MHNLCQPDSFVVPQHAKGTSIPHFNGLLLNPSSDFNMGGLVCILSGFEWCNLLKIWKWNNLFAEIDLFNAIVYKMFTFFVQMPKYGTVQGKLHFAQKMPAQFKKLNEDFSTMNDTLMFVFFFLLCVPHVCAFRFKRKSGNITHEKKNNEGLHDDANAVFHYMSSRSGASRI